MSPTRDLLVVGAGPAALTTALAAARAGLRVTAVSRDSPQHYERAWRRLSLRSRWLTAALLAARNRPALAGRIVPLTGRAPWLFRAAVGRLARG